MINDPFEARILQTVDERHLIPEGARVCVCLSGGADSVSLLLALRSLSPIIKFDLSSIHINHKIRGEEAERDQEFCRKLCNELSIPFTAVSVDVPKLHLISGKSLEETARDARYAAFEQHAAANGITLLATAHTATDNAETVLMRVIRGTSAAGMAGIPAKRKIFIRPLIDLTRDDVIEYLQRREQRFVTDSSNFDEDITRNYLRACVFPALCKINPAVHDALCRLSKSALEDDVFINSMLSQYEQLPLAKMPSAIAHRIIRRDYGRCCGGGLTENTVRRIVECSKQDTRISLPGRVTAVCRGGKVSFFTDNKKEPPDEGIYTLKHGKNVFAGGKTVIWYGKTPHSDSDTSVQIDQKELCGEIRFRKRRSGDAVLCRGVHRSVKKEWINKKIPKEMRDCIPVFIDDNGLVYVPFIGAADRIYTHADDANIISVSFAERQEIPQ